MKYLYAGIAAATAMAICGALHAPPLVCLGALIVAPYLAWRGAPKS